MLKTFPKIEKIKRLQKIEEEKAARNCSTTPQCTKKRSSKIMHDQKIMYIIHCVNKRPTVYAQKFDYHESQSGFKGVSE